MRRIWPMALMAGVLGWAVAPASAAPEAARWDTYFYAAPRSSARVLDEVERETPLNVRSCEAGWCRVVYGATEGFVREEIVHGPSNDVLPGGQQPKGACFTAVQPGGGAWQDERFCPSKR
ncbi:SH3 domain-containing protein [Methylobacterium sp. A49B]